MNDTLATSRYKVTVRNDNGRNAFDTVESLAKIAATLALPIVLAYAGYTFAAAQRKQELRRDYVQLAVTVLQSQNTKDNDLRGWAVQVLNENASVKLSQSAMFRLSNGTITIPPSGGPGIGTGPGGNAIGSEKREKH